MGFGQRLRLFRRQCRDPQRGGMLTQERLGELIGVTMGDAGYSGAAVSDWEREKSKIHADDRRVLVALLVVLHECGGIGRLSEADELLVEGNYRRLDRAETAVVFPEEAAGSEARTKEREGEETAAIRAHKSSRRSRAERILLQKVKHFWVDGVLRKSISDTPHLELSACAVAGAVDHPWESSLGPALLGGEEAAAGVDILGMFDRSERALLILGSPGSGKTTTLITLASHLLDIADKEAGAPMPVLLDLAGWAKERRELPDWIVEELTAKYQIPRRYGRRWLENDELILLLDGFDVLPAQARVPCIKAINRFRETNGLSGLAVCSRSQEYFSCGLKVRLNRAVRIEPLDWGQIERYLMDEANAGLRKMVRRDEAARQMAQSPLMLNVLAAVSAGDAESEGEDALASTSHFSQARAYQAVFEAYTRRMFRRRPAAGGYDPEQTVKYLQWLAGRLEAHSLSVFMIESMQPSWLPSKRWRWVYMLLSGAVLGAAGGVIMWLLWRLLRHTLPQLPAAVSGAMADWFHLSQGPVELVTILLGNIALGMLAGLLLIFFFERRRVEAPEASQINRQRWLQVWVVGLVCGLVTTLFVSLFTGWLLAVAWGVAEGFMYMAAARFIFGWSYENDVRTVEALGWSWQRALTGSVIGVILTVIAEVLETLLYGYNGFTRTLLTLILAGFILGGLTGSRTTEKSWPNQGVWLSLRNAGAAALFVSLPLALLTALLRDTPYAALIGALTAMIAAALFGLGVFAKHFLLRGLLRSQHSLPWRYSRFLDYAAQLVFLRKVGGGYIFMHRLLQQYFASDEPGSGSSSGSTSGR